MECVRLDLKHMLQLMLSTGDMLYFQRHNRVKVQDRKIDLQQTTTMKEMKQLS